MEKPIYEEIDEGGGYLCNVAFCPTCGKRLYGNDICTECKTLIDYDDDKKVATHKMSPSEIELLKEIRKQTQAPYSDIAEGIRIYKLDKKKVLNYLREIAVVYA